MLHYLAQKLKFEYIEKQEIIFYNVVVVLQDAFYKNENNLWTWDNPIVFNLHALYTMLWIDLHWNSEILYLRYDFFQNFLKYSPVNFLFILIYAFNPCFWYYMWMENLLYAFRFQIFWFIEIITIW